MKITKLLFVILVLCGVALVSYKLGQRSVAVSYNAGQIEERVKNDLVALTRQDFEEYQNLKSLEERYKKADEILGKIVTVFLADLGLKLNFKPTSLQFLESSSGTSRNDDLSSTQALVKTSETPSAIKAGAQDPVKSSSVPLSIEWAKKEDHLLEIRDEKEAFDELRKMPIPDLYSTLRKSRDATAAEALMIEGRFQGEITFFNHKEYKTDWLIEWEVRLKSVDKANGSSEIMLTRKSDGVTFSHARGSGTFKEFLRVDGSKALIVNVQGDDGYIQVYPLNNTEQWVGNYYEKKKSGTYEFVGQVRLNKVQ